MFIDKSIRFNNKERLRIINAINKKKWWRTSFPSKEELEKRGVFLASTYEAAEFYGRPFDKPFHVKIKNPYISTPFKLDKDVLGMNFLGKIRDRFKFDEKIKEKLVALCYDSVVIIPDNYFNKFFITGKLPKNIELNVFNNIY